MTDSYHFESVAKLEPGEFVINADESVTACLKYSRSQWTWDKQNWACEYKSMEAFTQNLIAQGYKRSEAIVFPSGASVLTSGDKIVGRVEAGDYPDAWESLFNAKPGAIVQVRKPLPYTTRSEIATYDVSVGNRLLTTDELHDALRAVLDSLYAAPKTQRAPLPNSDEWRGIGHKDHDTFGPDFIVTKGAEPTSPLHTSPTTDSAYPAIAGLLRG